jgi:hypothetical protein
MARGTQECWIASDHRRHRSLLHMVTIVENIHMADEERRPRGYQVTKGQALTRCGHFLTARARPVTFRFSECIGIGFPRYFHTPAAAPMNWWPLRKISVVALASEIDPK